MADESDQPSDRLRERAEESRWKLWFLLEADRRVVTGVLLLGFFVVLQASGMLYPTAEASIRSSDSSTRCSRAFSPRPSRASRSCSH